MCKADYVHCVKEIMSIGGQSWAREPTSPRIVERPIKRVLARNEFRPATMRPKQSDVLVYWYIIVITDGLSQRCQP
jgi:hypothetical protein